MLLIIPVTTALGDTQSRTPLPVVWRTLFAVPTTAGNVRA